MELHLVRHPAPLTHPGTCYGRTDLPVAPSVMAAAAKQLRMQLRAQLRAQLHPPIFTSPLQRCAVLARALDADARADPRLAEIDFGAWEMRAWDAIERAEIDAWAADVVHYRPGGGESVLQMATRIAAFYDDLARQRITRCIVICHAGSIRLLAARHRGLAPLAMAREAAATPHAIAYGEIVLLRSV